jgi:NAD(P)-dependent dehydrogenase (short-subunit alcohol dehydrogenase family)
MPNPGAMARRGLAHPNGGQIRLANCRAGAPAGNKEHTREPERDKMSFHDQTIMITGGLGGIGGELTRQFLALGARVVVTDRPGVDGSAVAQLGESASYVTLDVTSETGWVEVVDSVVARHGRLDALINIAGVFTPGIPFLEMSLAQWRKHMDVNLDGSFLGCRVAMAAMSKTGGGAIVNFSSGLAYILLSDAGGYCVSKAAVLALTRLAAKAGGKHRVRVNAVLPGAIETPMLWGNLREGQDPQELIDMLVKQHPIGRLGQPSDVARAVVFLCDPANSFVTGALLAVDGGQLVD